VKQLKKESLREKTDEPAPVKFDVSFGTERVCMTFYNKQAYFYHAAAGQVA